MPKNPDKDKKQEQDEKKTVTKKQSGKASSQTKKQVNKAKSTTDSKKTAVKKMDNKTSVKQSNKKITGGSKTAQKTDDKENTDNSKNDTKSQSKSAKKENNTVTVKVKKEKTTKKNSKEIQNKKNKENDKKSKQGTSKKETAKKEASAKDENKEVAEEVVATTTEKENVKLVKWEEIKNIFKKKKKIPKEALKEINKPVFHNIIAAVIMMVYFIFLILGFYNIENSVYQTDLKVFSMCILFLAIILLEKAYKEDSGKIAIFGIEAIVIAVVTLGLIYVNLMLSSNYINIVLIISYIVAIYYVVKSIVVYHKGKKKYFVDDMKEMLNTDEE